MSPFGPCGFPLSSRSGRALVRAVARPLHLVLGAGLLLSGGACKHQKTEADGASVSAAAAPSARGAPTSLNSSIMLLGDWDWHRSHGRCKAIVDEALSARNHNATLSFVPTQYGILQGKGPAITFCHSRRREGSGMSCPVLDAPAIQAFKEGMTDCLAHAVRKARQLYGKPLNVTVVPHMDDGADAGAWRNSMRFHPTPSGFDCSRAPEASFYCAVLKPLAEAVGETVEPGAKVSFSMQGEMGGTVFGFPKAYAQMIPQLEALLTAKGRIAAKDARLGLSFNFDRVAGDAFDAPRSELHALFQHPKLRFVGLSSYGALSYRPHPLEFENTVDTFAGELAFLGISLEALQKRGVELHFSEFGLGGGNIHGQKAAHGWLASSSPWGGVHGGFAAATNPWSQSAMARFQEDFYCAGLRYLSGQPQGKWRIHQAFIWNLTSWDVQAVYPYSRSWDGSYRNDRIGEWIRRYNETGKTDCPPTAGPQPRLPQAKVLDQFEGYGQDLEKLKRLYLFHPKAIGLQDLGLDDGPSGKALRLTYKLGNGTWDRRAGIWIRGPFQWRALASGGLRLQLTVKGDVSFNGKKLLLGLRERSGEYHELEVPWPSPKGGRLEFPFARLKAPRYADNGSGDQKLDLDALASFYLMVVDQETNDRVETILIDQLELY